LRGRHLFRYSLHALTTHHATNTAHNEQYDVIEHLGKSLIHRSHGLQWLNHEGQAVEHECYDASQDQGDNDYNETPDTGLKFFSGQTTLRMLIVVRQFVSPKQGLQDNLDSLE
jgi:hypothetical protein